MAAIEVASAERIIRDHVLRQYESQPHQGEDWRDLPEIPSMAEIVPEQKQKTSKGFFESWNEYQKDPLYNTELPKNIIDGPWPSKEKYIGTHYQLLREDAVAGLRNSVKAFLRQPNMIDDQFTHVYTHVHFKGLLLSHMGVAFRIEFSHERAEKQIRWEQSTRLQQGTIVALSPMNDAFQSICKIAIVAARPIIGGLDRNPPEIDIFWGDAKDAVFDPVEPYVMVEARGAYFEASRHMLVALQKLRTEQFRLSKHLVDLDPVIEVPEWLEAQRLLNLTSLIHQDIDPAIQVEAGDLYNADVLKGFPDVPCTGMDESQLHACEHMVTKKISIVQGPPGTGKTFTSVSALRVLIENLDKDSPPIIIAAQTNHALDQLMNHILLFEPNILRLGGRSDKENIKILERTLYKLRGTNPGVPNGYKGIKSAKVMLEKKQREVQETVQPLVSVDILSDEILFQAGIITETQKNSLYDDELWANNEDKKEFAGGPSRFELWIGAANLVQILHAPVVNMGLPLEECDLEYEQLQDVEREEDDLLANKDEEALSGVAVPFGRTMTGRCPPGFDDRKIRKMASKKDLHDIPLGMRGPVYRYWEKQLSKIILTKLKIQLSEYKTCTNYLRIAKWLNNFRLIKHLCIKVVGCTTTGLSKYRGLLAALRPRILLIEEAAETLEGTVMAGMFESLEQLILVGDHQQLQAHTNVRALEFEPYNLSVSMFERLVNNSIPFTMLNQQRRMIPQIRKLLCIEPQPFYRNLQDHPSVMDRNTSRPPIPGMGGKDTYFFSHNWNETKATDMSRSNVCEAEMVVEFFHHLYLNGVAASKITVLTFYNGQRKIILQLLKTHKGLRHHLYFNVFTVDSYQGEENDVVLLSLVRSNTSHNIGFLDNKNRLVVALSRARRGLYIFGNSLTLTAQEIDHPDRVAVVRDPMWSSLIRHMSHTTRCDVDGGLPITCSNHGKTIQAFEPEQFELLAGGCDMPCGAKLDCDHPCTYKCHPFEHSRVICKYPCIRVLGCGHGCSQECGKQCICLVPHCKEANFRRSAALDNDQLRQDEEATWAGPIMGEKNTRNAISQSRGVAKSAPAPKKGFTSQDIRKTNNIENQDREFSGSASKASHWAGNGFSNPSVLSGNRNFSPLNKGVGVDHRAIDKWNSWDAKKADKEAEEIRQRRIKEAPPVDYSKATYNLIYRATKIENGIRVPDPASSSTMVIQRFDESQLASFNQASNGPPQPMAPSRSPRTNGSATPQTATSSTLIDLAAIDIGAPNPFGDGDFDQFEKQFG